MSAFSSGGRAGLMSRRRRWILALVAIAIVGPSVPAVVRAADLDVYQTQAAAVELPSIYGIFRRPGDTTGGPLDVDSDSSYAFQAYLDTGTSGIILSAEDTDARDVAAQLDSHGNPVEFGDVAVNGTVTYHVSEPLDLRLGRYTGESLYDVFTTAQTNAYFSQVTPGVRAELSVTPVDPLFGTPLNLVGMPALKNKVMVVDARLYNHLASIDTNTFAVRYNGGVEDLADFPTDSIDVPLPMIQTWVYDRNAQTDRTKTSLFDPGVPTGGRVVRMSYADFSGFTTTTPNEAGVVPPTLAHNPFVGPAPFSTTPVSANDPPGITLRRGAKSSTGSWLFDSGAQISFMSSAMALSIGVKLTFDANGEPVLTDLATGVAPAGLFSVALGGAGGDAGTLLGFTVGELDLPTTDGVIRFHDVQIGVLDVTVSDGTRTYTLDGDLGMNLLLPTMDVTADNTTSGAFDFLSFDEATGRLTLIDTTAPEPTLALATIALATPLLARRRRRQVMA